MADNKSYTILIIDDEDINRKVLSTMLETMGYTCVAASSGAQGLERIKASGIDLVLLDIMMPDMDGFEVAEAIRKGSSEQDLPIIMITALSAREDRLRAVQAGANDFIAKPIDSVELRVRMESLLRLKEYHDEIKRYKESLEEMVQAKTRALKMALTNLHAAQEATVKAHLETLSRLSRAAEFKDQETAQHIQRMSRYAAVIAEQYGLPEDQVDLILYASPMHDIGKIGIPDAILLKPARLSPKEWVVMQQHCEIGAKILESTSSRYLSMGGVIALSHHEKWDGSGYPNGLSGEDIPLFGRICSIADVFDALTSKRPYKEVFSNDKALDILREGRGNHFQPELLDVFLDSLDRVFDIQQEFQD